MCSIFLYVMSKPTRSKTPGSARKRRPTKVTGQRHLTAPATTTDRQAAILDFISESLRDRGYPPTIREIGEAFGIASTNGVRYYLDRLEQSGRIRRDRWTSRGIELQEAEPRESVPHEFAPRAVAAKRRSPSAPEPFEIPILGRVAAGAPILAEENIEDVLIVDGALVRPGKHFALRVRGDSMKNAGILDKDLVIVRHESEVKSGEIAVVLIGDEATVKRIFPRRDKILLLPENEDYEPIEVRPTDPEVRVAGRVVGVIRRLG
jgi:repressor LexA